MKTALIVDDSRVARAVLRKTLAGFGVEVDEVPSAEAAIEHLKLDSPDIIFLDHMMPGMDGFDALGALKANPRTATIPVLMYTTQEGQFYASQARALGAVDVLPKSVAPADIERILRAYHLIGEPADERSRWTLVDEEAPARDEQHELIERFRAVLDERALALMSEFRRELHRAQSATASELRSMQDALKPEPVSPLLGRVALGSSFAALTLALAAAIPHFAQRQPFADGSRPAAENETVAVSQQDPVGAAAFDSSDRRQGASDRNKAVVEPAEAATEPDRGAIVGSVARGLSSTRPYAYGEVPLDDASAREYALVFAELKSEGFTGTVQFDVYAGRYCLDYEADGSVQLAPPEQSAASCDTIGSPDFRSGAALQSPMFASMVDSATRDRQFRVDTVWHGSADPLIEYPRLDYSMTAADWNAIADTNQRISMRVVPAGADGAIEPVAYLRN
jgi:CheY-like chemotaxis protein